MQTIPENELMKMKKATFGCKRQLKYYYAGSSLSEVTSFIRQLYYHCGNRMPFRESSYLCLASIKLAFGNFLLSSGESKKFITPCLMHFN